MFNSGLIILHTDMELYKSLHDQNKATLDLIHSLSARVNDLELRFNEVGKSPESKKRRDGYYWVKSETGNWIVGYLNVHDQLLVGNSMRQDLEIGQFIGRKPE